MLPAGDMPYAEFGNTGMKVSRLSFGSHIDKGAFDTQADRDRQIIAGYQAGINLFDVYDHMNDPPQFAPMGDCIRPFRKDVLVSLCSVAGDDGMQGEIDMALEKFHTDYIDLYRTYACNDDRVRTLEQNRDDGKVRAIGLVSHKETEMMERVERYGDVIDYVMIPYNFHHNNGFYTIPSDFTDNTYTALIPRCEELGLGIIGIKPIGSDAMAALALKKGYDNKNGADVFRAMIAHVMQHPEIDTTMPAMNSMHELAVSLKGVYNPKISEAEQALLDELSAAADATETAYLPEHYKWLEEWAGRKKNLA
jgi:aryl-alcohol dehydrogenase-like predicted oxidoreductase